jgi:hypothetical protein
MPGKSEEGLRKLGRSRVSDPKMGGHRNRGPSDQFADTPVRPKPTGNEPNATRLVLRHARSGRDRILGYGSNSRGEQNHLVDYDRNIALPCPKLRGAKREANYRLLESPPPAHGAQYASQGRQTYVVTPLRHQTTRT